MAWGILAKLLTVAISFGWASPARLHDGIPTIEMPPTPAVPLLR